MRSGTRVRSITGNELRIERAAAHAARATSSRARLSRAKARKLTGWRHQPTTIAPAVGCSAPVR
jgi:hypothetical protein